jgi:hypothetical protein
LFGKEEGMKNKTSLKLILDAVMVALFMLMFKKQVISMSFHEIGGLIFLAFILVHVFIINRKWVAAVTKKVFSKDTATRLRIMYLDDFLLLVVFVLVGISAVLISHIVFSFNVQGMTFKAMHYAGAAVALILIGIHLGLHRKMYAAAVGKKIHIPEKTAKIIGIVISVILVAVGIYAIGTTSFLRWLSMPFTSSAAGGGEGMQMMQQGAGAAGQAMDPAAMAAAHGGQQSFSLAGFFQVLIEYFSIAYVFAAATAVIDNLVSKRK